MTPSVNGAERVEASVGDKLVLEGRADSSSGRETFVEVAWDLHGAGNWVSEPCGADSQIVVIKHHGYQAPRTYFAGLRVRARPDGMNTTPFGYLENISRVRIIVT